VATCPLDCEKCTSNSQCGATQVCLNSYCLPASGQKYVFTMHSGKVLAYKADGTKWDSGSGTASLPDPFAAVYVDGTSACQTSVASDTTSPVWEYVCKPVTINANSVVDIYIFHDYWTKDDEMMDGSEWSSFVSILHAGKYVDFLYGKAASISFDVKAVP
jgi:hypothetical protein